MFAIQWLHIFFGIFWFGGALFSTFVVGPQMMSMAPDRLREFAVPFGRRALRVIVPVAVAAITLGALRGTVFGPLKSVEAVLTTTYGLVWLTAFVAAMLTLGWAMHSIRSAIRDAEAGTDIRVATRRAFRHLSFEMFGFAVILTAMVLMRFGV